MPWIQTKTSLQSCWKCVWLGGLGGKSNTYSLWTAWEKGLVGDPPRNQSPQPVLWNLSSPSGTVGSSIWSDVT